MLEEIVIDDVCEALLEQVRQGALVIRRYHELSEGMLRWIEQAEAEEVRKRNLLQMGGPMADYIRTHYLKSWAAVESAERSLFYHGSAVPGLTSLEPRSDRGGEKVLYLSGSPVYALLYLWDQKKTGRAEKWVTGWLKNGVTYYEEQFPGQLRAFYSGVRGWVYCVDSDEWERVGGREDMALSREAVPVRKAIMVDDVYELLIRHQAEGRFRLLRFEDASAQKQEELTERVTSYIRQKDLHSRDDEESGFFRRYFSRAWERATEINFRNKYSP